jgi:hypothetical protein
MPSKPTPRTGRALAALLLALLALASLAVPAALLADDGEAAEATDAAAAHGPGPDGDGIHERCEDAAGDAAEAIGAQPDGGPQALAAPAPRAIRADEAGVSMTVLVDGPSPEPGVYRGVGLLRVTVTATEGWREGHLGDDSMLLSVTCDGEALASVGAGEAAEAMEQYGDAYVFTLEREGLYRSASYRVILTDGGLDVDSLAFVVAYEDADVTLTYLQPDADENGLAGEMPHLPDWRHLRLVAVHVYRGELLVDQYPATSMVNAFPTGDYELVSGFPDTPNGYIRILEGQRHTLIILHSTEKALVDPESGQAYNLGFVFDYFEADDNPDVTITIRVARLRVGLAGSPSFAYGSDVGAQAADPGFLDGHATLTGAGGAGAALRQGMLADLFDGDPLAIEALGSYPAPDATFGVGWGGLRPEHAHSVALAGGLTCGFTAPAGVEPHSLVLNDDEGPTPSCYDGASGVAWVRTPLAALDGGWSYWPSLSWPGGAPQGGRVEGPLDPGEVGGLTAVREGPGGVEALVLCPAAADCDAPAAGGLIAAADSPSALSAEVGAALVADGAVTVTLTISDAGSGVAWAELASIGPDGSRATLWSFHAGPGGAAPESVEASLTLSSDAVWPLSGFEAAAADMAGNAISAALCDVPAAGGGAPLAAVIVDSAGPSASLSFADGGPGAGHFAAPREATLTVWSLGLWAVRADMSWEVARVSSGGVERPHAAPGMGPGPAPGEWGLALGPFGEGPHSVRATYADPLGRALPDAPEASFAVDTRPPLVRVSLDGGPQHSLGFHGGPVTATVEVSDDSFDPSLARISLTASDPWGGPADAPAASGWSSPAPGVHVATVRFAEEGSYSVSASATDLAGWESAPWPEEAFTIDMTPPALTVIGVSDQAAYAGAARPSASFSDLNLEAWAAGAEVTRYGGGGARLGRSSEASGDGSSLTVSWADFPREPGADGVYLLAASCTDRAGNVAEARVRFSVNRFGSTYWFGPGTEGLSGSYIAAPRDLVVHEVNASGLDEGRITLRLARDSASRELALGEDYTLASETLEPSRWHMYTYVVGAGALSSDGRYALTARSWDLAGSLSENPMPGKSADRSSDASLAFVLDTHDPLPAIEGVADGGLYVADSVEVVAYVRDNIAWASAVLLVDGEVAMALDNAANEPDARERYSLAAAPGPRTLTLRVTDRAGNVAERTVSGVVVVSDLRTVVTSLSVSEWWDASGQVRAIGATSAAVSAAGLALALLLAKRRRDRRREEDSISFNEPRGGAGGPGAAGGPGPRRSPG